MSNIVYNDVNIKAIADAIRAIDGTAAPIPQGVDPSEVTELNGGMTPHEMADRIANLFWAGTQEEYDAILEYNPSTLYLIVENSSEWDYEMTTPLSLDGETVLNTEVKPFSAANNGESFEYYASFSYDDNAAANFGTSMLMSLNTSSTAGTGSMYWTGGGDDADLTHSQMLVHDPGFGFGGGSYVATTYIQDCIRGTNFRKRSGSKNFTMKSLNDNNCSENVFHVVYDAEADTFTATLTHRYVDTTEDESEIVLDLNLDGEAMAFSDSDMPLLIGGCLTEDYTVGTYQRYVGSSEAPVTLNYCRFRFL